MRIQSQTAAKTKGVDTVNTLAQLLNLRAQERALLRRVDLDAPIPYSVTHRKVYDNAESSHNPPGG